MRERRPLRADIREEILAALVRGEFAPGERIVESRLARTLDVSRTPLREVLICLVDQGLLVSRLGRGFQVPPLDPAEIHEIGRILALLEPRLVAELVPVRADLLMELGNALSRMRLAITDPAAVTALCQRFSATLAHASPNRRLGILVLRQVELTLRYLRAAHQRGWDPTQDIDRLQAVSEALRRGDAPAAAASITSWRQELTAELSARCEESS